MCVYKKRLCSCSSVESNRILKSLSLHMLVCVGVYNLGGGCSAGNDVTMREEMTWWFDLQAFPHSTQTDSVSQDGHTHTEWTGFDVSGLFLIKGCSLRSRNTFLESASASSLNLAFNDVLNECIWINTDSATDWDKDKRQPACVWIGLNMWYSFEAGTCASHWLDCNWTRSGDSPVSICLQGTIRCSHVWNVAMHLYSIIYF